MSEIDSGGPAFPHWDGPEGKCVSGISKREWFAGMALNAVYTDYMVYSAEHGMVENWRDGVAGDAYKMADVMIRVGKGEK